MGLFAKILLHLYVIQITWVEYPNLIDENGNKIWYKEVKIFRKFVVDSLPSNYVEYDTVSAYTKGWAYKKYLRR
jgi:hypothetical protein